MREIFGLAFSASPPRGLRKAVCLLGFIVVAVLSGGCAAFPTVLPQVPEVCDTCSSLPGGYRIESFATQMDHPVALAWRADGSLLVTEQGGDIRLIKDGKLQADPWTTIPHVRALNQIGLIGIAANKTPGDTNLVYVYYEELPRSSVGLPAEVLLRIEESPDGQLTADRLFDDITGSALEVNMSGMVHIGPDGYLYIGVGDAGLQPAATEKLNIPFGKILRLKQDGSAAANPFVDDSTADKRVFALGFEGAWDFAFNDKTGTIYTIAGIPEDKVQVRAISTKDASATPAPGAKESDTAVFRPIFDLDAPNDLGDFGRGIELYTGQQLAAFDGNLFVCLGTSGLWRLTLDAEGARVLSSEKLTPHCSGDVTEGPDGFLYFVDTEHDEIERIRN